MFKLKTKNSKLKTLLAPCLSLLAILTASPSYSAEGTVWAWGKNSYGQFGDGTNTWSNVPVQSGISGVTTIAGGQDHTIALKNDGTVWVWGSNSSGQLGNGTNTDSNVPVQVSGLTGVTAIAAGSRHSIALKSDGTVWAWGSNSNGQLGNGTTGGYSNVPVQLSGFTEVVAIAGGGSHSIALRSDGTVWAWGDNGNGQLGDGTNTSSNVPGQVSGLTGVTAIAANGMHTIALKSDGSVWAWGYNGGGQLGNGTFTSSNVPVQVSGLTGVTAIAAGGNHTIAIKSGGTVWAWGQNLYGQLGDGTDGGYSNVPVQTSGLTGVTAIAAGGMHAIAIKSDGSVWAWGYDGEGTNTYSNVPVQVSGLNNVIAIGAGGSHSLAVVSGSDTAAPSTTASPGGGTYTSAQGVTLTANETATIYYTTDGTTPTTSSTVYSGPITISSTTTLKFFAKDSAGNSESVKTETYTIDGIAPGFTSTSPASDSSINTATAGYALSEDVSSGKVTFTRTGGTADSTAHIYNFTSSDMTAGTHSVNTGLSLVNGAIYTATFEATDSAGNTGSVSNTNIAYDTSAASVTITIPAANSITNNAKVTYTLSENVSAGDIVFTRTGGVSDSMSPYTYTLGASERTAGSHTVDTGKVLMDGAVYTLSFENVKDMAGNSTAAVSNINVKYDTTAVAITNITPAANSIINGSTVTYTLSEQAQSGKVTFTRTGGAADANSPHVYDLTASDLTSGSHTVNTNMTLADGAFYTVSFDATDLVGNAATTVSNAMVYYDSNYGIGPTGNVDNTSYSANRVDGYDLIKLSIAFGSKPGDANWNPVCDLDNSGKVDGSDLIVLGNHFGEVQ